MANVTQPALSGAPTMDLTVEQQLAAQGLNNTALLALGIMRLDFGANVFQGMSAGDWQTKLGWDVSKWVEEARVIRRDYEAEVAKISPGFRLAMTPMMAQSIGSTNPLQALVNAAMAVFRLDYPTPTPPVDFMAKMRQAVQTAADAAAALARSAGATLNAVEQAAATTPLAQDVAAVLQGIVTANAEAAALRTRLAAQGR